MLKHDHGSEKHYPSKQPRQQKNRNEVEVEIEIETKSKLKYHCVPKIGLGVENIVVYLKSASGSKISLCT